MYKTLVASLMLAGVCLPLHAQTSDPPALYIIFDASGSMWGQLPDRSHKVVVARTVLQDFVARDFGGAELALRAYGHRREGDCRDSELVVPFGPAGAVRERISTFAESLNPLGKTPISYSLRQALTDFGGRPGEIILITDGLENCDEDPCALVRTWRAQGVKVNVHVVGFGLAEQEKATLQCISEAAGTTYHDANSAMDLAQGLSRIRETVLPERTTPAETAFEGTRTVGFWLQGVEEGGGPIRVEGVLRQGEAERFAVSSNHRNQVEAGTYELVAGVRTANGSLYRPVRQPVTTRAVEDTLVQVEVAVPPSVRARFSSGDDPDAKGALIRAFQDDREVFTFRWFDEVFLDEGTYTFRTRPNRDNDLSLTETFAAGDHKELVFEMVQTVRAVFRMPAAGSEVLLRGNFELWQDGEKKYDVHATNGADVVPDTYAVRLVNDLTPHVEPDVVVAATPDRQEIVLPVPVGFVTFIYQHVDGTRAPDKRVFLARGEVRKGRVKQSGTPHPLLPGTYNVRGWRGDYAPVVFEVRAGEEREVVLRARQ